MVDWANLGWSADLPCLQVNSGMILLLTLSTSVYQWGKGSLFHGDVSLAEIFGKGEASPCNSEAD